MSVRAYRINNIEKEESESFNLWHDEELVEFLRENDALNNLNINNVGIIEIPLETLKDALKTVKMEDDTRQSLEDDIFFMESKGEDYICYWCY